MYFNNLSQKDQDHFGFMKHMLEWVVRWEFSFLGLFLKQIEISSEHENVTSNLDQ